MRGQGRVFERGTSNFWIAYYFHGKEYREPGGKSRVAAEKKLKNRLKQIYGNRFVGPQEERLTVDDLLNSLLLHLELKGAKAVRSVVSHMKPVREFFALTRAVDVKTERLDEFARERLGAGKARATVNKELGALRQAFNLGRKQGRLSTVPYVSLLKEDNARQGFFERGDFEAVVAYLPEPVNDIARFAYWSGWRRGEILGLTWDMVDRSAREIRLRTSKNGSGRVLPLAIGELWDIVERRWAAREISMEDGTVKLAQHLFHHGGRRFTEFKKSWATASNKAGVSGKLFHDLRRTAVRNMVRAGVPQSVAMSISGHKTTSMFYRYNITSDEDRRDALRRLESHQRSLPLTRSVVQMPEESAS